MHCYKFIVWIIVLILLLLEHTFDQCIISHRIALEPLTESIFQCESMSTYRVNIMIEKGAYRKTLWVFAPLIVSFSIALLVGKALLQIVVF